MGPAREARSLRRTTVAFALAALVVGSWASPGAAGQDASAGPGLVVCYPNAPGSTEAARPVMERLGAHLTWRTGFEVQPIYTNDAAEARRWIDAQRPRFAILSLPLFLRWREELGLTVVAQSERAHAATERYHLVVANDSPVRSLADLKKGGPGGRDLVLWSSHLDDARFVSAVVFEGALQVAADDAGDVRGVVTAQPLRALRRMKAGEAFEGQPVDAVLLEDSAWNELQKIASFRESLRAAHVSPLLPTPPVVAIGAVDPADVERVRQALVTMHEDEKGRELLSTLQVTGFGPPTPEAMNATVAAYAEGAPR